MSYYSWVGRMFSSKDLILNNTLSIAIVDRTLYCGTKTKQDFRYRKNSNGEHRILMLDCDDRKHYCHNGYYAYLTDEKFFGAFVDGMLKYKEIAESDYDKIKKFLSSL